MKYRRIAFSLAVMMMVVVSAACGGGGGGGDTQPDQPDTPDQPLGLNFALDPAFGEAEISTGFLPDPFTVNVTSGGSVDVSALDIGAGCTGHAAQAPDYRIQFEGTSSNLRIFFVATGGEDTTLIVNRPDGSWVCNDDTDGYDPMVEMSNAQGGQYDIWVGSYSSGELIAGTLYVTEYDYSPEDYQ